MAVGRGSDGQIVKPNSYPCHVSPKIASLRTYPSKHPTFPEYWLAPSKAYFAQKNNGFPLPFLIVRVYSEGILPFPLRIHSENSVEWFVHHQGSKFRAVFSEKDIRNESSMLIIIHYQCMVHMVFVLLILDVRRASRVELRWLYSCKLCMDNPRTDDPWNIARLGRLG